MASLMLTHWSSTAPPLILSDKPNGAFLPRQGICLRTTASAGGLDCNLSIRSASSDAPMVLKEQVVAFKILKDIKLEASRMKRAVGVEAGIAVVYKSVDRKSNSCIENICKIVGLKPFIVGLAEDSSEEEVLKSVSRLNDDPCVHGIIVLTDLPSHLDKQNIVNAIAVEKNVEGFHPLNIGRGTSFAPCFPKACIELLRGYNIHIKGKRAVVIGRGNTYGIPIALLLQREDATVTIIHSKTSNPEEITRQADIVISAAGQPNMLRGSWIKPGAVVINVGAHLKNGEVPPGSSKWVIDICYEEVCKVASAITPLDCSYNRQIALALVLSNTLTSAKRFHNFM